MWMTNPRKMCRQHLLGEHLELHMFAGSLKKGISVEGYADNNLLEAKSIVKRHKEIAKEMERRGWHHNSPLESVNLRKVSAKVLNSRINRKAALRDLKKRCVRCRKL
jgi:hypothetical protein